VRLSITKITHAQVNRPCRVATNQFQGGFRVRLRSVLLLATSRLQVLANRLQPAIEEGRGRKALFHLAQDYLKPTSPKNMARSHCPWFRRPYHTHYLDFVHRENEYRRNDLPRPAPSTQVMFISRPPRSIGGLNQLRAGLFKLPRKARRIAAMCSSSTSRN